MGEMCQSASNRVRFYKPGRRKQIQRFVVVLLVTLRYSAGMTGMGLLRVSTLHAALAVWCIAGLRMAWLPKRTQD
jgi:hypothetical protein